MNITNFLMGKINFRRKLKVSICECRRTVARIPLRWKVKTEGRAATLSQSSDKQIEKDTLGETRGEGASESLVSVEFLKI